MIGIYIKLYNNLKENYLRKVKKITEKYFHTHIENNQDIVFPLHPEWIVGFTDAEGSFHLSGRKNGPIKPKFSITLNIRDILILKSLQAHFNMGSISIAEKNNAAIWTVSGNKDIFTLIENFNIHKLRTKKLRDFLIWKRSLRYPLHDPKRLIYQNLLRVLRPREFTVKTPLSIEWLIGFIEGEGCFLVELRS